MKELATLFKALADESRLRILNLLIKSGELCVCDIEATTGFTQTKVSRHLAYLKEAGLVRDRRQGLWMLYSIARPRSEEQRHLLTYLKSTLDSQQGAKRDAKILAQNIRSGCCATFKVVKPRQLSTTLKLLQLKGKET
jgi:ArsR family transcriptional regulator